jgi:protein SCO1/2
VENNNPHAKKIVWFSILISGLFILALALFVMTSDNMPSTKLGGKDGKLGGEFTLSSSKGDISLSDFKGKLVLIYFGFTNCKYVCPNSLNTIKNTLNRLSDDELSQVQPIFISVDPARDTYARLDEFTQTYHSKVIGLRGEEPVINELSDEYGAYFRPDDEQGDAFRHTSRYYIVNQKGELVDAMRHSTTPNELAARIRTFL